MVFEKDKDGDERFHVYIVDLAGGSARDLTPMEGIRAQNVLTSPAKPREILVGLNIRDRRIFDMYRIDLATGHLSLDTNNPGDVLSWTTDSKFAIRAATAFDPVTGDTIIRVRNSAHDAWHEIQRTAFADSLMFGQISGGTVVAGFGPQDGSLYIVSAAHSDKGALLRIDSQSGQLLETVATDVHSDVAVDPAGSDHGYYSPLVMLSPLTHRIQAVAFEYLTWRWELLDAGVRVATEPMAVGSLNYSAMTHRVVFISSTAVPKPQRCWRAKTARSPSDPFPACVRSLSQREMVLNSSAI